MSTLRLAAAGARAHRGALTGTFLVLALAGALLAVTGVLLQSGAQVGAGAGDTAATDAAMLASVAGSFGGTAIAVVVLVVASTVTLALKQRRRELALLRAIGATKGQVRRLIGTELALVAVVAAPAGAVPGLLASRRLTPLLVQGGVVSPGFQLTVTAVPVVAATVLLVPVALLAAILGTRETLRTPPTEAVRESTVEPRAVGRGRRLTALGLAVCGVASAGTPLFVPGTVGSASAATAAFLLLGAAAVAGPLLIAWCLDRATVLHRLTRGAPGRLAVANTRGFSRRLTTAIVPLTLALTAGTVQSTTNDALAQAAHAQLTAGLHADVVVTPAGRSSLSTRDVSEVVRTPGVRAVLPVTAITAQVHTDSWEPASLSVVPTSGVGSMYDLAVTRGSLAALSRPDTIAASTDALFGSGVHVGDRIRIRLGGVEESVRVVASYARGLGFGDYFAGAPTVGPHEASAADAVLVQTAPGASRRVQQALRTAGLTALDKESYISSATTPQAGQQRLSLILLLALLAFVALGAANTLAMTTASRRSEFALLRRTGATRRQLLAMTTWEAGIAALTAWVIATAATVPAVVGVELGLLGPRAPYVDLRTFAALSALVGLIALLATVVPVGWQLRSRHGQPSA